MKWYQVTKSGIKDKPLDAPAPMGVCIAQRAVPDFPDNQYSLNYFSLDGHVMGVRLCCNGQQRDAAHKEAVRYI